MRRSCAQNLQRNALLHGTPVAARGTPVALHFPEGLLMYSLTICDILEAFTDVDECFILGDVTYGACCVDNYSATALRADFLIHYGYICLVPIDFTSIPCLYVFVDIQVDVQHLVETAGQFAKHYIVDKVNWLVEKHTKREQCFD